MTASAKEFLKISSDSRSHNSGTVKTCRASCWGTGLQAGKNASLLAGRYSWGKYLSRLSRLSRSSSVKSFGGGILLANTEPSGTNGLRATLQTLQRAVPALSWLSHACWQSQSDPHSWPFTSVRVIVAALQSFPNLFPTDSPHVTFPADKRRHYLKCWWFKMI